MAARARWRLLALPLALFLVAGSARGLAKPEDTAAPKPPVPKAISVSSSANSSVAEIGLSQGLI